MDPVTGRLVLNPKGFGFLEAPDQESYFVPPKLARGYFLGDECEAEVREDKQGRFEVTELTLLSRARERLLGRAAKRGKSWVLELDPEISNSELPLIKRPRGLRSGTWVEASIAEDGARVERRIPKEESDAPSFDVTRIVDKYGLELDYPKAVKRELERFNGRLSNKDRKGRRDLRDLLTVTIDGPSTRDIDDAISVLPADGRGGLRLFVSIADVAEHVRGGSALDQSALARGTSVYLIGQVLPMFPPKLSEQLLSLLPGKERLAMTAEMRIDPEGKVTSVDLYESIIKSDHRLTYAESYRYLSGQETPEDKDLAEAFSWFRTAHARLGVQRRIRGGIERHHVEPKVEIDEDSGAPSHIVAKAQNAAHLLIERFMVAANEAVAGWLHDRGLPALYRVHPSPEPDRVPELAHIAENFGFRAGFDAELTPLALSAFGDQIRGAPSEAAVLNVLMRILGRASYTPQLSGHFGLASTRYLHFTSPIRRYADLAVHRVIKAYLRGERVAAELEPSSVDMDELAQHINRRAAASARAEAGHQKIVWARYLSERIGERFTGHITRIKSVGLFVQLNKTRINGLLPLESLPGRGWRYLSAEEAIVGKGKRYEIGQRLEVEVADADPELGRIEFDLVKAKRRRRKRSK